MMRIRAWFFTATWGLLLMGAGAGAAPAPRARVWETRDAIPTYLAGDPEPNPMFYFGRQSQGAQGPVYPYPMYDSLTGRKVDKTYTVVHLENEYIRISVLPEIGGRILEGVDKTNNYNFIYRQHVIKPALIGLIGAWISGGVEWNIPHHHRASTFVPVQYKVEDNADGSKTVWVGELEIRQRMRWAVGYTLRPGKAYLETSVRILNRTPVANTMLCFANVAVHVNDQYQVIFPPSTQFGTHHAKREFTGWPVSHGSYGGADFTRGVDISYYRNHISPNSVFAWNYADDFFAGYDHGKQAGTMSVADHNVVPEKKFWTWGNGPNGKRWDTTLTDDDGPYIELMVGGYSDNQPDYSWLQPFETRVFTTNFYPFRDIGGVKSANLDAAVDLDVDNGAARLGFYATSAHPAARAVLKAGGKVLFEQTIAIDPGRPFLKQIPLPAGTDEHELTASLWDGAKELVSYTPLRLEKVEKPAAVTPPEAPQQIKTVEELYLTGLRAWQFHDPAVNPQLYWQEALNRDPGNTRVNTMLGIVAYTGARYQEAERYLRKAIDRLTDRYTQPKDAEAVYYLAATLKAEGNNREAAVWFHKATWSQAWKATAYYSLAQIAAANGDWEGALGMVNSSIDSNALNLRAQTLKAAVLRHLGRKPEALQVLASGQHATDPLDVRALAEIYLATGGKDAAGRMTAAMNLHPATAQETAAEYFDEGLWQDGADVLAAAVEAAPDPARVHPLVFYYLGYFAGKLGDPAKASACYQRAAQMPADYVFPFQNEAIDVLREAIARNPRDARAPYYLGNLLYDWQPEEAARLWESSAAIDPSSAITHRNLATAYMHQGQPDLPKAIAELDELYEQSGAPVAKRLSVLRQNAGVVAQRDDAMNRLIAMQVAAGELDAAIQAMTARTFAVAEGANLNVVEHWTNAHILRAQQRIRDKRYGDAIADLEAAAEPAPEAMRGERGARAYYQALALEKLGQADQAKSLFEGLVEAGKDGMKPPTSAPAGRRRGPRPPSSPRAREANAHYLAGLGYLGLNDRAQAKTELALALDASPDLVNAQSVLSSLQ